VVAKRCGADQKKKEERIEYIRRKERKENKTN
jgi:hypothetical protein